MVTARSSPKEELLTGKLVVKVDQLPVVDLLQKVLELFGPCAFGLVDLGKELLHVGCIFLDSNRLELRQCLLLWNTLKSVGQRN